VTDYLNDSGGSPASWRPRAAAAVVVRGSSKARGEGALATGGANAILMGLTNVSTATTLSRLMGPRTALAGDETCGSDGWCRRDLATDSAADWMAGTGYGAPKVERFGAASER